MISVFSCLFSLYWQKFIIGGVASKEAQEEILSALPSQADVPKLELKNPFDMTKLSWLPVTPPGATVDTKLQKFFNWTLTDDFLIAGDP